MSLKRSAWRQESAEKQFSDYILILPERNVIISFTSMQDKEDRRLVWGCWIHEEADSVVYTAIKNAKTWRRESYRMEDERLTWNNGSGSGTWVQMDETAIPENLRIRGTKFLDHFCSLTPPEYTPEGPGAA